MRKHWIKSEELWRKKMLKINTFWRPTSTQTNYIYNDLYNLLIKSLLTHLFLVFYPNDPFWHNNKPKLNSTNFAFKFVYSNLEKSGFTWCQENAHWIKFLNFYLAKLIVYRRRSVLLIWLRARKLPNVFTYNF